MTDLTFTDRLFRDMARYVDKPTLAYVPSQKALRVLFAVSVLMGGKTPRGTSVESDRRDGLIVTPRGVGPDAPLLFYVHGGGFTIGSPRTHLALASHIAAAAGMRLHMPGYPLAPEHPFPAAAEAILTAYRSHCDAGDAPAAIAGDSAGGNLAMVTAMAARDTGLPLPRAIALIAPALDLTGDIQARADAAPAEYLIPAAWAKRVFDAYLDGADPADPRLSPLKGDLSGLPPIMVQANDGEALAEDARALAEHVPGTRLDLWHGVQHVWQLRAGTTPAGTRACAEMGAWIKETSAR
ncbi:esterase [Roseibacterium elongatum DSM 19469]|uniref:Esterase n=1 Tax=Roseicyclus elongatus DSM 19469 TaxID=1294273 RepID=W8RW79_9RHOB|nr:alpha/beta hydrolase [Roseibacterium elongatum]AHM05568.1 esterase [Roseibacterium elongatum DSM 19469]